MDYRYAVIDMAICLKHLRTVSADDATILWWVNSTSAIPLIFTSSVTVVSILARSSADRVGRLITGFSGVAYGLR